MAVRSTQCSATSHTLPAPTSPPSLPVRRGPRDPGQLAGAAAGCRASAAPRPVTPVLRYSPTRDISIDDDLILLSTQQKQRDAAHSRLTETSTAKSGLALHPRMPSKSKGFRRVSLD